MAIDYVKKWSLKERFKDLIFKNISISGQWGIIATGLLLFKVLTPEVWLAAIIALIAKQEIGKHRAHKTINGNKVVVDDNGD